MRAARESVSSRKLDNLLLTTTATGSAAKDRDPGTEMWPGFDSVTGAGSRGSVWNGRLEQPKNDKHAHANSICVAIAMRAGNLLGLACAARVTRTLFSLKIAIRPWRALIDGHALHSISFDSLANTNIAEA